MNRNIKISGLVGIIVVMGLFLYSFKSETLTNLNFNTGVQVAAVSGAGSGLIAHYTFDEGSGSTAVDASGNGNNASIVGSAVYAAGKVGSGAIVLDGANNRIELPGMPTPRSIALWIKPVNKGMMYVGKGISMGAVGDWTSTMQVYLSNLDGTAKTSKPSSKGVYDGGQSWWYVVWVDDNGTGKLYINGVQDGASVSFASNESVTETALLGTSFSYGDYWGKLSGMMDDVRLYDRPLTSDEISELYGMVNTGPSDETAPSVPENLSATAVSSSQIDLTWSASTDDTGVAGYRVYRGSTMIGTTQSTSYSDGGRVPNTTYEYKVSAYDVAQNSSAISPGVSVTTKSQVVAPTSNVLIPSDRLIDWTPNVSVGVPGGIVHRTTICTTVNNAPSNPKTTQGSMSKGSNQLSVSSIEDFEVGHGVLVKDARPHWSGNDLSSIITAINGNIITLKDPATASVTNVTVTHDDSAGIQSAINHCPENQVVYLPAGVYVLKRSVHTEYKKKITIRGDGNDTVLDARMGGGGVIGIGGGSSWKWDHPNVSITSSPKKGATSFNVSDVSKITEYPNGGVGVLAKISIENDTCMKADWPSSCVPVVSTASWKRLRKQMVRITGISGNKITFTPPLHYDLPSSLDPRINLASSQSEYVGIEDMRIEMENSKAHMAIGMDQAYAPWVKNVTMNKSSNRFITLGTTLHCEFRGNVMSERNGVLYSPNGAGIMMGDSTNCLIEDNIITKVFSLIQINSSSGNVIAYNYGNESTFNINHGPHSSFNLYEGNVTDSIQSDGYFGGASHDVIFRNWFFSNWTPINLKRFSYFYSVVGNIIGDSSGSTQGPSYAYPYHLGYPNIGNQGTNGNTVQPSKGIYWPEWDKLANSSPGGGPGSSCCQEIDLDVEATLNRRANYIAKEGRIRDEEALGNLSLPNSLYRNSKPGWFGSLAWPPIDPMNPSTANINSIPAGYRFNNPGKATPGASDSGTVNDPNLEMPPDIPEEPEEEPPIQVDLIKPTVSITTPINNSTIKSSVSIVAEASDNVGVVGVQFKLDGDNLGNEDVSAPYSGTWNTTSASNGAHTLTAIARDAAGNTTTSAQIKVIVSNQQAQPPEVTDPEEERVENERPKNNEIIPFTPSLPDPAAPIASPSPRITTPLRVPQIFKFNPPKSTPRELPPDLVPTGEDVIIPDAEVPLIGEYIKEVVMNIYERIVRGIMRIIENFRN